MTTVSFNPTLTTHAESNVFYAWGLHDSFRKIDRGEGIYLYDRDGNRYLDAVGGSHLISIGHGVSEIAEAIASQARNFCFLSKGQFTSEPMENLATLVTSMAPEGMNRVCFASSGSDANELALQVVYYYHQERGKGSKYKVIGRSHSYHGRTAATQALTSNMALRENSLPYSIKHPYISAPYCYRCPLKLNYPSCELACADELVRTIEQEGADTVAAVIIEPILCGAVAAVVPPPDYYRKVREICDFYDILLIADEVVTGFGRTGKNFAMEHWDTVPDIMTIAKGLSSGYAPIGGIVVHDRVYETFMGGNRKSVSGVFTYSGHPIACAAALAVQQYIIKHNLVEQCASRGEYLKQRLEELKQRQPFIGDVRGKGLLMGVEFVQDRETHKPFDRSLKFHEKMAKTALKNGLLLKGRKPDATDILEGDQFLISPAFIISERQCDELVELWETSIEEVSRSLGLV
ncbi:MAG: aminotransferase class III-fold pyridoxal phosphate-dependent enzyme [Microcoleaceae cyanobacterium]